MHKWLLPECVEDILPHQAERIERLRRELLDLFRGHGYRLVMPPLVEYLDSILTGTGRDLDRRTFKLVDPMDGRLLGLRADMTPQVARIDAHLLNREGVTRLCYAGSVLHAEPAGLFTTREPLQVGAELYGHGGIDSDVEVARLMTRALAAVGLEGLTITLGHVAVFRALAGRAGIVDALESDLFGALQNRDLPALAELAAPLDPVTRDALLRLPDLFGDAGVVGAARAVLPDYPEIRSALDQLDTLAAALAAEGVAPSVDLADLRGYHYHSGLVFAAYAPGHADAVALGGRYDHVGRAFGRARPATGFSTDLRAITRILPATETPGGILAPRLADPQLALKVAALRAAGEVVVEALPGETTEHEADCDRILARRDGDWTVIPLAQAGQGESRP